MACPAVSALVTSGICARCECHGICKVEALVIEQLQGRMKLVTIRDAIDVYIKKCKKENREPRSKVTAIKRDAELMGIPLGTPICEITEDRFDVLVENMRKDGATHRGMPYRNDTILGHLRYWQEIDGPTMRKLYQKEGYDLMAPIEVNQEKYGIRKAEVQQVSMAKITKLAEEMVLLKRGDKNQRNVFLFLFMALYVGLSKVDIMEAKWGNFKDTPNGKFYVSKRHKTGKGICVKIPAQVWAMLEGFEKKDDEHVIILDTRGQKGNRNGDKLRRRAGEVCKKCGIGGEYAGQKTCHALRKFKAQLTRVIFGVEESARVMAHSTAVNNRNYSSEMSAYTLVAA